MDEIDKLEKLLSGDPVLDSNEAMSGLLSVVDALCQEKTRNNYDDDDDNNDNDDSDADDNDDENNDDDTRLNHSGDCDKHKNNRSSVDGSEDLAADDDNDWIVDEAGDIEEDNDMVDVFGQVAKSKYKNEGETTLDTDQYGSLVSQTEAQHPKKVEEQTEVSSSAPNGKTRLDIQTYIIDNMQAIMLSDVNRAVREACGTCSHLRNQLNKLGIIPRRVQPQHMLRLRHMGAVGLQVKCCSYILLQEFVKILQEYKDKSLSLEDFHFLPSIEISSSTTDCKSMVYGGTLPAKEGTSAGGVSSTMTSNPIHTFIVNGEIVVCAVELQQVFELLFGCVFSMSLSKLGIFQKKLTTLQLDEVMDFVDIDDSGISSACFYVTKKDGERVFQYAEALFNVDHIEIRWMEPLKLSDTGSASLSDESLQITERSPTLQRSNSACFTSDENPTTSLHRTGESDENPRVFMETEQLVSGHAVAGYACSGAIGTVGNELIGKAELNAKPSTEPPNLLDEGCDNSLKLSGSPCATVNSGLTDTRDERTFNVTQKCSLHSSVEPRPQACDLPPLKCEDSPSSNTSDASNQPDLDSCSAIRTYVIDGREVVCIPDIHKIVIHLYGQSVQVGYYLQRLQIPTQRFSTVHVKRLKALSALNSKATLCTYILKSDALRLIKMYDVFCNESKLHQIQWNSPVSLEGVECTPPKVDTTALLESNKPTFQLSEPIDVVKIPTFLINGEVVVSVPDAHKVVQVLNGQSVQVRYNMDKLGIVKRKYSYSQVYQLRAISDLKRPSMCTFITKADADKLITHYLTPDNASRLKYIQWLVPVRLEELPSSENSSVSQVDMEVTNGSEGADNRETSRIVHPEKINTRTTRLPEVLTESNAPIMGSPSSLAETYVSMATNRANNITVETRQSRQSLPTHLTDTIIGTNSGPILLGARMRGPHHTGAVERGSLIIGHSNAGRKRSLEECKEKDSSTADLEIKRLKAEKDDIAATLERKETEMQILHDAYQQQVTCERERRLKADKEAAEMRVSNEELQKNLQRKESEMKILHDSYQYQIRKEREKREELENDLTDLRGSVAFASGVAIRESNIKQENF